VPVRALLAWPAGLGDQTDHPVRKRQVCLVSRRQGRLNRCRKSARATLDQPYDFAAITDLYFAAAFLPDAPARATVVTCTAPSNFLAIPATQQPEKASRRVVSPWRPSGSPTCASSPAPKITDLLKTIHATGPRQAHRPALEPAHPVRHWLGSNRQASLLPCAFDGMLGPHQQLGWAIIIVTVIFTVVMLPLRFMAMRSSLKMMRIQPKAEAIKKRYAHSRPLIQTRREMNTETMALYKAEASILWQLPAMLPQIPSSLAYFRVLQNVLGPARKICEPEQWAWRSFYGHSAKRESRQRRGESAQHGQATAIHIDALAL